MRIIPDIPMTKITPNPELSNNVQHWGFFTKEEIKKASADGSLLMLDIDFGRVCSNHCPGCFRRLNHVDDSGVGDLSYDELLSSIDQACELGLRSVKICGAGEPFENPDLLRFARDLTERNVGLAIFTKGHVLGDDEKARSVFGCSGKELATELMKLNISVLLSFPSFDSELLSTLVGDKAGTYPGKLKRAAEILTEVGFNAGLPTRLAFVHAPLTKRSIDGAIEVYRFARERNILPVLAFHMVSGEQIDHVFLAKHDPTDLRKMQLFQEVLRYNFEHGIQTPKQIMQYGSSCMPGIHPCNQIATGLYLTANGNVVRCPGDSGTPLGNVREKSISKIWKQNREWQFSGSYNCGCPYKDGITIPKEFYVRLQAYAKNPIS